MAGFFRASRLCGEGLVEFRRLTTPTGRFGPDRLPAPAPAPAPDADAEIGAVNDMDRWRPRVDYMDLPRCIEVAASGGKR